MKNTWITAKEARKLAGPIIEEIIDEVMIQIENAAKAKLRAIELHDEFWIKDAEENSDKYKDSKKILEDLGYTVELFDQTNEYGRNIYTIISW